MVDLTVTDPASGAARLSDAIHSSLASSFCGVSVADGWSGGSRCGRG